MQDHISTLPWLPAVPEGYRAMCKALDASAPDLGSRLISLAMFALQGPQATSFARKMTQLRDEGADIAPLVPLRLTILSSATFELVADHLTASAARYGIALDVTIAPYDQVLQVALNPGAGDGVPRPDCVLLAVDHRWFDLASPVLGDDEAATAVAEALGKLESVLDGIRQNFDGAAVIVPTLAVPPSGIFGNYERRVAGSLRSLLERANTGIVRLAEQTNSFVLDVAAIAELVGTSAWFDPAQWNQYKLPFNTRFSALYCDHVGRVLGAIKGHAKKCLVLDLDNTIWAGVIGDDGMSGIEVGQGSALGEAHQAVQRLAMDMRSRGVILAVSSKNELETALEPFRKHPDMLLREQDISVFQANWSDKPSNLEAIAQSLNIGLDALVLLDDNPAERAHVRSALPMVGVPELPLDPSYFAPILAAAGYFEPVSFSAEDRGRAQSYAAEAVRKQVKSRYKNIVDYLNSLEMKVQIDEIGNNERQRSAQLINKSNQFNLMTRRYTEEEIDAICSNDSVITLYARLQDKFGDFGLISVLIAHVTTRESSLYAEVDTWVMSCRVLGRRVEEAMLSVLVARARSMGVMALIGKYRPTAKNGLVEDHYRKLGFAFSGEEPGGILLYRLELNEKVEQALPMEFLDSDASEK